MSRLVVYSVVYLIISGLGLTMGYYVLRMHAQSQINKIFFAMSACISLWSLGFSIILIAPDEASAVFWTRVSAIGYSFFYSILLHFTLALTVRDNLLKKWIYPLIYAPAAVCLYAFVISTDIGTLIYHFNFMETGWVRTTPPILFDGIFNVYFFSFALGSFILLGVWRRRSKQLEIKKQSVILIAAIASAIALGVFTDIANDAALYLPIPKMAPLLFLIPLAAIFYCIKRYHFMEAPALHQTAVIISNEHRRGVFTIASIGFIAGGVLLFILECFWWRLENPAIAVFTSLLLVIIGILLADAQRKQKTVRYFEFLFITASLTVIPLLTINMTQFGGLTMWAFPVIMIICSLVFNMRLLLFSTAVCSVIMQLYLWGSTPIVSIVIDYRDYTARVVILLLITASAYFVHRIYTKRLVENAENTRMQSLLNYISASFASINATNVQDKKRALMDALAEYYGAARVFVYPLLNEYSEYIPPLAFSPNGTEVPAEYESICMNRWQAFVATGALDFFSKEQSFGAQAALPGKADSPWLFIPVFIDNQPAGFMHFEAAGSIAHWTKEQRISMYVVSRIASGALEKISGESRIRFMAYYDSLTMLPNRQLFKDRAEQAVHLARRNGRIVGIMFLDLDSFKSVNDTLGHEGGDELIQAVAEKLSRCLRKSDTLARFGGDEFLIMFNSVSDVSGITAIADKIMKIFKNPFVVKEQKLFITASAGISVFPADGEDAQMLIKHADIAMYSAKEKGKNQYVLCSCNMKELVQYKMTLSNQLYRALDNREFAVYYQPLICLQTGKIAGVEALLRWFHPDLGVVPPCDFIPLAEQTGLINPIGQWVLEKACAQNVDWQRKGFGNIRLAVNLSVVQLRNNGLVDQVKRILAETGIDPGLLELEITESATTREPDYIVGVLNDLKVLGLSIAIDDFGTEYSSLNRLKMLPIDRLKMDIQFVHGIDKSSKDQAITTVIINLAKNLDLKLIAEGVESSSQLDFLKQRMCDEVQGFYYYKPMPAAELEKILQC